MRFSFPGSYGSIAYNRNQRLGNLFAIVLIAITTIFAVKSGRFHSKKAIDYYHFWVVGQAIRTMEVSDVYSRYNRNQVGKRFVQEAQGGSPERMAAAKERSVIQPTATPFQYALFDLISTGDYDLDYDNFFGFSLFVYMTGIFALARMSGMKLLSSSLLTFFATTCFWPLGSDVKFGNVTQLQIGLVALHFWVMRGRTTVLENLSSGIVLAFAFLFKPNIIFGTALLVGAWLVLRDWESILWHAVGLIIVSAIAVWLPYQMFGDACSWEGWFKHVPKIAYTSHYVKDSLPSILFHTVNRNVHRTFTLLFMAVILFIVFRGDPSFRLAGRFSNRSGIRWRREAFLFSLGLCTYLLTDPFVHGQYFLFLFPILCLIFGSIDLGRPFKKADWIKAGACVLGLWIIASHMVRPWHAGGTSFDRLRIFIGAIIIFIVGMIQFIEMSRASKTVDVNS